MAALHGWLIQQACKEGEAASLKVRVQLAESAGFELPVTTTALSTIFGIATLILAVVVGHLCRLLRAEREKVKSLLSLGAPLPTFPTQPPEAVTSVSGPVSPPTAPQHLEQPAEGTEAGQVYRALRQSLLAPLVRVSPFLRRPTSPPPQSPIMGLPEYLLRASAPAPEDREAETPELDSLALKEVWC